MTVDLQKTLNGILLLLIVCFGLLSGRFAADWFGMVLAPEESGPQTIRTEPVRVTSYRLQDFGIVGQRNLFDSNAEPVVIEDRLPAESPAEQPEPATEPIRLKLLGTVAGGDSPLAVLQDEKTVAVYHLGDPLPGELTLTRIERDRVVVESRGGTETVLELVVEQGDAKRPTRSTRATRPSPASSSNIVAVGDNHWEIPREEADNARSNLNALLKTARMVPKIEQGETVGFTIVSIRRGTFLDLLGLKVGDILVQINDVELNSPEKALQIFQQVREANNITLGLLRDGSRQTFEYTIN